MLELNDSQDKLRFKTKNSKYQLTVEGEERLMQTVYLYFHRLSLGHKKTAVNSGCQWVGGLETRGDKTYFSL